MNVETRTIFSRLAFPSGAACLVFDRYESGIPRRIVWKVLGQGFTLLPQPEVYCTGRYELSTFASAPCPDGARITDGKNTTCYACFQYNGFNPSFYNVPVSTLSAKQRTYNNQPHVIYLAAFGPGVIKVGISHHQRVQDRWCEQGALGAAIIGRVDNAYDARELELWLGNKAGLPELVKKERKLELLTKPFGFPELQEGIRSVFNRLRPEAEARGLAMEEVLDLNHLFFGNFSIHDIAPFPQQKNGMISGICRGLAGSLMILEHSGRRLVCSLNSLFGHQVHLSREISDLELTSFQPSLF